MLYFELFDKDVKLKKLQLSFDNINEYNLFMKSDDAVKFRNKMEVKYDIEIMPYNSNTVGFSFCDDGRSDCEFVNMIICVGCREEWKRFFEKYGYLIEV